MKWERALPIVIACLMVSSTASFLSAYQPAGTDDGPERAVSEATFSSAVTVYGTSGVKYLGGDIYKGANYFYAYANEYSNFGYAYVKRSVDGVAWPGGTGTMIFFGLDRQQGGYCVYTVGGSDHIIASTMGYIKKSTNNGSSFTSLTSLGEGATFGYNSPATNTSMDPSRAYDNNIYVAANRGIDGIFLKKSTDDGVSWSTYTMTSSAAGYATLIRDNAKLYCFYTLCTNVPAYTVYNEIYVMNSTDWGKTWGSSTKIFTASENSASVGHAQYINEEKCLMTIEDLSTTRSNSRGIYGYFWFGNKTFQQIGFETSSAYNSPDGHKYSGIALNDAYGINYTSLWCYEVDANNYLIKTHYSHDTNLSAHYDPAPTIVNVPLGYARPNEEYSFNASATVPDNGTSIWDLVTNATWLSKAWSNDTRCLVNGTPGAVGHYWANLTVSDSNSSDYVNWTIVVILISPHDPIFIEGNAGFLASNATTGVVRGSGTAVDPYVIEGWLINATGIANAIFIGNTTAHFVISACSCYNSGYNSSYDGIRLINVQNGQLVDNVCILNNVGIHAEGCSGLLIRDNSVMVNYDGISLCGSDTVNVSGNMVFINMGWGIYLNNSLNIAVHDNNMSLDGIVIDGDILAEWNTHTITPDNRINMLPVLYYKNGTSIDLDGVSAGQIIIANYGVANVSHEDILLGDGGVDMGFVDSAEVDSCNFTANLYGIYLFEVEHAAILNSNISFNSMFNIELDWCGESVISGNTLTHSENGIFLNSSTDVSVIDNLVSNNTFGIEGDFCSGLWIVDNTLTGNVYSISFWETDGSSIESNSIYIAHIGVYITLSTGCSVERNDIHDIYYEGVGLEGSDHCTVSYNDISSCNDCGVILWESSDSEIDHNNLSLNLMGVYSYGSTECTVWGNNFDSNSYDAYMDSFSSIYWDAGYPLGGNHWAAHSFDDYFHGAGQDLPGADGIGDSALYDIVLGATIVDNYPLTAPSSLSSAPPVAAFSIFPVEDSASSFAFNASACSDADESKYRLQVRWDWENDGTWDTSWSVDKNVTHQFTSDGNCTVKMQVMDTSGLTDDCQDTVTVGLPPVTSTALQGSAGSSGWYISDVNVSLLAEDAGSGVNWTKYRLNSGDWVEYSAPFTLDDGSYTIEFYSVDNVGNIEDAESISVKVDTVAPTSSASYSDQTVTIESTDNTSGVEHTYYRIDGGDWQDYVSPFVAIMSGDHVLEYYSVDNAGNNETVKTLNLGQGPGVGLETLLVAALLALVIVVILVVILVKRKPDRRSKSLEMGGRMSEEGPKTPPQP